MASGTLGRITNGKFDKTGSINLGTQRLFYKLVKESELKRELSGYKTLAKHYPVPKFYDVSKIADNQYVFLFEKEGSIGKNEGLLIDLFATRNHLDKDFIRIIKLYKNVFLKTLTKSSDTSSCIFFSDRVQNRLPIYYQKSFLNKKFVFTLNGRSINMELGVIVNKIERFFSAKKKRWSVVSQCDPNDLNIGIRPVIFDFTAGGMVPLMAEFATLFWYQLAQGSYLSLKYNDQAFKEHRHIYKRMNRVDMIGTSIKHIPSKLRVQFLEEYIEQVIEPCFDKISDFSGWYEEFKNYIAMKIIGVFNVSEMDKKDMLLSLGYLYLFYETTNITEPRDLLKLIK